MVNVSTPFKYSDKTTPKGYKCNECGAEGVALWRDYQTFLEHQTLRCFKCVCKKYDIKVRDLKNSVDSIGWSVIAVPTEEGDTYWGYTSIPEQGIDWWRNLPLFS